MLKKVLLVSALFLSFKENSCGRPSFYYIMEESSPTENISLTLPQPDFSERSLISLEAEVKKIAQQGSLGSLWRTHKRKMIIAGCLIIGALIIGKMVLTIAKKNEEILNLRKTLGDLYGCYTNELRIKDEEIERLKQAQPTVHNIPSTQPNLNPSLNMPQPNSNSSSNPPANTRLYPDLGNNIYPGGIAPSAPPSTY